jgi:hypothetical protein
VNQREIDQAHDLVGIALLQGFGHARVRLVQTHDGVIGVVGV